MKRLCIIILLSIFLLALGIKALTEPSPSVDFKTSYQYHNLGDENKLFEITKLLEDAGLSTANAKYFSQSVKAYEEKIGAENLWDEIVQADVNKDPYAQYASAYRLPAGGDGLTLLNDRLTAYLLGGDLLMTRGENPSDEGILPLEKKVLEDGSEYLQADRSYAAFASLYSDIPTVSGEDVTQHLASVQQAFKNRGLGFMHKDTLSLISVLCHFQKNDADFLRISHAGVLLQVNANLLYFIEKLSFEQPFQVTVFANRQELNDYLMGKYDRTWKAGMAAPFIMENDALLEGYRTNPFKQITQDANGV